MYRHVPQVLHINHRANKRRIRSIKLASNAGGRINGGSLPSEERGTIRGRYQAGYSSIMYQFQGERKLISPRNTQRSRRLLSCPSRRRVVVLYDLSSKKSSEVHARSRMPIQYFLCLMVDSLYCPPGRFLPTCRTCCCCGLCG